MYVPASNPVLRQQHESFLKNRRHINAGAVRLKAKTATKALNPRRGTIPAERMRIIEELSGLLEPVFLLLIAEPEDVLKIETIQRAVAGYYKKSLEDICSMTRRHSIVRPRYVSMYLARKYTRRSLAEIGLCYNGKDQTVVLYGIRAIARSVGDTSITQAPHTPAVAIDARLCEEIAILKKVLGV